MKKENIFALAGLALILVAEFFLLPTKGAVTMLYGMAAIVPRNWSNAPGDNTGRLITRAFVEPVYAATITIVPNASITYVKPAVLTGALTLNATLTSMKDLDEVIIMLTADTTKRVVTLGSAFVGNSISGAASFTIPVSGTALLKGIFDLTANKIRLYDVNVAGKKERIVTAIAYAATIEASAITGYGSAKKLILEFAQLTGALTLNWATVTALDDGDEIVMEFATDGTQRVVTFGTNILASGTVTIPANKTATVRAIFDGTNVRVTSREISA